jgi:Flp pilus assembly protein TadD
MTDGAQAGAAVEALRAAKGWVLRHRAAACAAVAAAVFANTLPNRPVLDDGWAVIDNPLVRTIDFRRIFDAEYGYAGGATLTGPYRPIATLTWAAGYALHGRAPFGFHLVNVALHAAATALVLLLARRVLGAAAPERASQGAFGAALLFAVHPAHVEAVAPIVARADLLAAVGGLGALLLALGPRSPARLFGAFAALAGAMLSKETAVAVPLLYLLVATLVPGAADLGTRPGLATAEGRRALLSALGVAAVLAAALLPYVLLRPTALTASPEAQWFGGRSAAVVWNTMTRAGAEYLRILAFPARLMTDFGYAARIPFTERFGAPSLAATAVWGTVLAAGVLSARRAPVAALAILWTYAALLPVLNVLPIGALMAERFLYLPSVGACILAGQLPAVIGERLGARGARVAAAAGAAVLAALAARTVVRNADWRDPLALWKAELRSAPLDPVVNNNLAVEYSARGDHRRARERLEVVVDVAPRYWRARVNLGIALHALGDHEGALRELLAAAAIAPSEASPHFFLGIMLAGRGDLEGAVRVLGVAEGLAPEDPRTLVLAGKYLAALKRFPEARAKLERAAALDPRDPEPRRLLASLGAR